MTKLPHYIHRLTTGFSNVGQLGPYTAPVATITIVNMKIIPGNGF
jgi:hypothetical protein